MNPNPAPAPRLMHGKTEAAHQLSISVRTLEDLLARREIHSVKIGGRRLIPHTALEDYVAALRADTAGGTR